MATNERIPGTEDAWDNRQLGADPAFAEVHDVTPEEDAAIDRALDLHPISIRLPKSLIDDFKAIAEVNGMGYQPLMRQILTRFADSGKKRLLMEAAAQKAKQREEVSPVDDDVAPRSGTHG
ncbi:MAG: hypothetical protein WCA32_12420 [Chromatiaceae bacterium]